MPSVTKPVVNATNDGSGIDWTNPEGVFGAGVAEVFLATSEISSRLRCDIDPATEIPVSATIDGIEVQVHCDETNGSGATVVLKAQMTRGGSAVGADWGYQFIPSSMSTITLGGPTKLWSETWTAAQFIEREVGVEVWADNAEFGIEPAQVNIDWVQVTVYYTLPAGGSDTKDLLMLSGCG